MFLANNASSYYFKLNYIYIYVKSDEIQYFVNRNRNFSDTSILFNCSTLFSIIDAYNEIFISAPRERERELNVDSFYRPEPPQRPLDCSLHNESGSLEINCVPGSDGGSPQHFLLEVRGSPGNSEIGQIIPQTLQTPQSDQGTVGESPSIYQDMNQTPNFQLHDLEPGYDYTVYVYAINGRGRSEPALLEHIRVVEPIGKLERSGIFLEDLKKALPQASSENMIIAIALTGTGKIDFRWLLGLTHQSSFDDRFLRGFKLAANKLSIFRKTKFSFRLNRYLSPFFLSQNSWFFTHYKLCYLNFRHIYESLPISNLKSPS